MIYNRIILLLFIFCSVNNIFAQEQEDVVIAPYHYVYNNGEDTIHLSKLDFSGLTFTQTVLFDSIQINDFGSKEIILARNFDGQISQHGGTFDITETQKIHQYEIWNIDTKTLLFVAKSYFFHEYNRVTFHGSMHRDEGSVFYFYNFKIDKEGTIILSKLNAGVNVSADHKMGSYRYHENGYVLIENLRPTKEKN